MDLRAIRELVGKTQAEVAADTQMTQGEISRLEQRRDYLLSTMRRYIDGLGCELEINVIYGDKRLKLRSLG